MDDAVFEKYLSERYNDQLNWYDNKAKDNQKNARLFQNALVFSSALTPIILISHFVEHSPWLAGLALTSAIVNLLISGVLRTYQFEEHWHRYRSTCEDLRSEIHFYGASVLAYRDVPDKEAIFVQRVEDIISRERQGWQQVSSHREPSPGGH